MPSIPSYANQRHVLTILLAILAFLGGCAWPTADPATLRAVRAEAQSLMADHAASAAMTEIPHDRWPRTIAGLEPKYVAVDRAGVDILMKPYFDGGWGYHVSQDRRHLPMPAAYYTQISPDVYWHAPC